MRAWKRCASAFDSSFSACSRDARRAEVVALAADAPSPACRSRRRGRGVTSRPSSSTYGATCTSRRSRSSAGHLADAEAEVVPVRLRQVVHLVRAQVHAAGGDLVQLGLPDMGAVLVDQRDVGRAALAQRVAEARGQLQAAGTAADDDDAVPGCMRRCSWCAARVQAVVASQRGLRRQRACGARPRRAPPRAPRPRRRSRCSACGVMRSVSRSPVHLPTTTVATPLPIRLVSARASDMKRSMPRISASPATGTPPTADSVAASTMKPLPVTPAAPLEVSSSTPQQGELLRQRHRRVGGLRDEHRRHRQVDRGAVEVERIAGGHHQADDGLAHAQVLQLGHHARQHRLARRGAEHDQQLFLDVLDELPDREAVRRARCAPSTTKMKTRQVA